MSDGMGGNSRRTFLRGASLAAAGAMVDWRSRGAFAATNRRVLGANDRINIGMIGVGGMGYGHLTSLQRLEAAGDINARVVAACDIYEPRKERAAKAIGDGAKIYHHYQELLADKDIDVVFISTPEHWHHRQTVDAMEAGLDVYLEKPITRYLEDAYDVVATAKRTGRVLQIGAQYASQPKWQQANELLKEIGKVIWSQTSYCRNSMDGEWNSRIDKDFSPDKLDWEAFVGPAEKREFDAERYFRWRKYWDYSTGICSDLFPHKIYPFMIAIGNEAPTEVTSTAGIYYQHDREVPDTWHLLAKFPSEHTMLVAGCTSNQIGLDDLIRGNKARMELNSPVEIVIRPEQVYAEEVEDMRVPVDGAPNAHDLHRINLLDCARTRATPNCGPDLALPGMIVTALGEISYREKRVATYQPAPMELSSPAVMVDGRVMVPLRPIVDWLGATMTFEGGLVTVKDADHTVKLRTGSTQALLNGQQMTLDAAPQVMAAGGAPALYVPLRAVAQLLGATVAWDGKAGAATVSRGGKKVCVKVGKR